MQLFVSGVGSTPVCVQVEDGETVLGVKRRVCALAGVPVCEQRLLINGRRMEDDCLVMQAGAGTWATAEVLLRVVGGKGGFGSMLRSMGARAAQKETTNFEACRDLNGRRLRNVHDEEKMAQWLAKEEERKKEAEEKKRRKQEQILRGPLHSFDHHKLGTETRALKETVDEALTVALEKRKAEEKPAVTETAAKKLKIWGDLDEDEDEEEEEEGGRGPGASLLDEHVQAVETSQSDATDAPTTAQSDSTPAPSTTEAPKPQADTTPATTTTTTISANETAPLSDEKSAGTNGAAVSESEGKKEEKTNAPEIDLEKYGSAKDLEAFGLDGLKFALMQRGLKCGGNLQQRAERLFSVKGLREDQIPAALKAKK